MSISGFLGKPSYATKTRGARRRVHAAAGQEGARRRASGRARRSRGPHGIRRVVHAPAGVLERRAWEALFLCRAICC